MKPPLTWTVFAHHLQDVAFGVVDIHLHGVRCLIGFRAQLSLHAANSALRIATKNAIHCHILDGVIAVNRRRIAAKINIIVKTKMSTTFVSDFDYNIL